MAGFQPNGPIAQLDRVPDFESGGRGFESSSVRHLLPQIAQIPIIPRITSLFQYYTSGCLI